MSAFKTRHVQLEKLEKRELMASDLVGGDLQIVGTNANDQIEVSQEVRSTVAFRFGRVSRFSREMIRVQISDANDRVIENRLFDASAVDRIFAQGLDGDDTIVNDTDIPSVLYGNDGDDVLRGGSESDTLVGGDENDSLYGREGNDILSAGRGNDGLFGGEDFDRLYGGSGANRYLNTRDGDFMWRPDSNDAVVDFRGTSYGMTFFGYFSGGSWSDEQVEVVDQALRRIHDQTGSTRLLKHSDGSRMQFEHRGHSQVRNLTIGGWNDGNVITVHHGTFTMGAIGGMDNDLVAQQNVLHEIGHNWDDPNENDTVGQFRRLSGWSRDGQTHRANVNTDFAREYGATDAIEDFATTFAAHFMPGEYVDFDDDDGLGNWVYADYTNRPVMQQKLAYMDLFDSFG